MIVRDGGVVQRVDQDQFADKFGAEASTKIFSCIGENPLYILPGGALAIKSPARFIVQKKNVEGNLIPFRVTVINDAIILRYTDYGIELLDNCVDFDNIELKLM
jgi:hypothetical protein